MRKLFLSTICICLVVFLSGCGNTHTARDSNGNILPLDDGGNPIRPRPSEMSEENGFSPPRFSECDFGFNKRLLGAWSHSEKEVKYPDGRIEHKAKLRAIPKVDVLVRPLLGEVDRIGNCMKELSEGGRPLLSTHLWLLDGNKYEKFKPENWSIKPTVDKVYIADYQKDIDASPDVEGRTNKSTQSADMTVDTVKGIYEACIEFILQEKITSISFSPIWMDEGATEAESLLAYQGMYDVAVEALKKHPKLSVTLFATCEAEHELMTKVIDKNAPPPPSAKAAGILGANKVARQHTGSTQLWNEVGSSISISPALHVNGLSKSLGKTDQYASAVMWSMGKYDLGFGGEVALENRQNRHNAIYALATYALADTTKLQGSVSYVNERVTSNVFRNMSWDQQGVMVETSVYSKSQIDAVTDVSFELGFRAHYSKGWTHVPFGEISLKFDSAALVGAVSAQNFSLSFSLEQ